MALHCCVFLPGPLAMSALVGFWKARVAILNAQFMALAARLALRHYGATTSSRATHVDYGGLCLHCSCLRIDCYRHRSSARSTLSASKFAHFPIAIFFCPLAGLGSVRAFD